MYLEGPRARDQGHACSKESTRSWERKVPKKKKRKQYFRAKSKTRQNTGERKQCEISVRKG